MEDLDLKELFMVFWNKKVQIVLIIAIFAVIGIIYTIGFVTPLYTSSTRILLVGQNSDDSNTTSDSITATDLTLNSKLVSTYSELITSTDVVRKVISNLGINVSENELKNSIKVSSVKDTEIIRISVTNKNPSYACKIANEIVNVFADKVAEIYNINNVNVVEKAEESTTPSNINHTKDVIIFVCIGIVVAIIYALIANMLDNTVKSREEIEKTYKIPVIAEIPLNITEKGGNR